MQDKIRFFPHFKEEHFQFFGTSSSFVVSLFLRFRCFNLPRITPSPTTFRFVILIASFSLLFLAVPGKKILREKQSKRIQRRGKGQLFCNPDFFHDTRSGDFFRERKMQVVFHSTLLSPSNFRVVYFLFYTNRKPPGDLYACHTADTQCRRRGKRRQIFRNRWWGQRKINSQSFSLFLVVFAAPVDL